jgi:amidase
MANSSPLTIAGVREQLRAGDLTPRACIAEFAGRLRASNPRVNAVVTEARPGHSAEPDPDEATGPLAGVPFTVKDVITVAGLTATAGSRALADWTPSWTAPAVSRLQRAGAHLVGKTNCPEFAYDLHTTNDLFGATLNPLFPAVTVGGSSGGDAAAVGAGMAAFGLGTDLGGSIRWPAACLGLTALRPTPGLVPGAGQLPTPSHSTAEPRTQVSFRSLSQVISPIARTPADVWTVVRIIAGPDPLDPHCVPVPLQDPAAVDLARLRIGWCADDSYPLDRDVGDALAALLTRLGRELRPVETVDGSWLPAAAVSFGEIRAAEGLGDLRAMVAGREHLLGDRIRRALTAEAAGPGTVDRYLAAGRARDRLRTRVLHLLSQTPVLLIPLSCVPPFPSDVSVLEFGATTLPADGVLDMCRAVTLVGLPAVAVPFGYSAAGLPISVQVVARPFHDHQAIAVATAVQHLTGWADPGTGADR